MIFHSPAPRPADEEARQRAVDASGLLDAAGDATLAAIVAEAAALFDTPIAAVSIVDGDRQYFPAEVGMGCSETPRSIAFCAHAMTLRDHPLCIEDATADARFAGNPLVLDESNFRFYAGMPLIAEDGQPLGALCVVDRAPRETPDAAKLEALAALARRVTARAAAIRPQA